MDKSLPNGLIGPEVLCDRRSMASGSAVACSAVAKYVRRASHCFRSSASCAAATSFSRDNFSTWVFIRVGERRWSKKEEEKRKRNKNAALVCIPPSKIAYRHSIRHHYFLLLNGSNLGPQGLVLLLKFGLHVSLSLSLSFLGSIIAYPRDH
jgi:hypothetical protein